MTPAFRAIQRGFDNVVANWQLILIRFLEAIVVVLITVTGVVATIVVTGVAGSFAGIFDEPDRLAEWIVNHLMFLVVACLMFLIVGFVAIVIHSFAFGGVVGCYIDADQAEGGRGGSRTAFRAFSFQRWLAHAAVSWWPVFLIYNIAWGLWGLLILVPVVLVGVLIFMAGESEAVIVVACLGGAVIVFIGIITGLLVTVWSRLSIVVSLSGGRDVISPLRQSISVAADRFLELLVLVVAMFAAGVGISGFFFMINSGFDAASVSDIIALVALPGRFGSILVESLASVFLSSWTTAGMVSIVLDRKRAGGRLMARRDGDIPT